MNISNISFSGAVKGNYKNSKQVLCPNSQKVGRYKEMLRENSPLTSDEFVSLQTHKPKKSKAGPIASALAALIIAGVVGGEVHESNKPQSVTTVNFPAGTSIVEMAEMYGSDEDVIKEFNNIAEDRIYVDSDVRIPLSYDVLEGKVEKLQKKLYKSNLTPEETLELQQTITRYQAQSNLQNQIANVYTDGDVIYYNIDIDRYNTSSPVTQKYSDGISIQEFEHIFGIKEGEVLKYNKVAYSPKDTEEEKVQREVLHNYQTVQVPINVVDEDYIVYDN